jgi:hypothetical protein
VAGKSWAELQEKYFCTIKFSTQLLISVWKIGAHWQLTSLASTSCSCLHNSSAIDFFIGAIFLRGEDCAQCKALKISLLRVWKRKYSRSCDAQRQVFSIRNDLVPLRRPFEAHFDDLMRIGYVVPASIRLPTFGNNLNESAAERRFSDMRDASAVGFDI